MGLFTMPGGGSDTSDATDDSTSTDSTSGDGSLSSLFGLNDIGSGYGVTTYTDPPTTTSTASDLGSLQSGSTATPTIDLTTAFADTLGTVVAIDSINAAANNAGSTGYYKAANGQVYAVGTGPGPGGAVVSSTPGNLLFWLLVIGGVVLFVKEEEK